MLQIKNLHVPENCAQPSGSRFSYTYSNIFTRAVCTSSQTLKFDMHKSSCDIIFFFHKIITCSYACSPDRHSLKKEGRGLQCMPSSSRDQSKNEGQN